MNLKKYALYYAVNDNPVYLSYVKKSIESLRKYNSTIKIFLFIFGDILITGNFYKKNNVEIIFKEKAEPNYFTSLKWLALPDLLKIEAESLLFADADTYFFADIMKLFDNCKQVDLYAREEIGTETNPKLSVGRISFRAKLNHLGFAALARAFKAKKIPVFNTGVMVFNNSFFKRIPDQLPFYKSIMENFLNGRLAYPSDNKKLIDEITASLVFGTMENFNYGLLNREISPWFIEFNEGEVHNPGILMHIFAYHYEEFARRFGLKLP
jgi:hypothetical protein